MSTHDEFERLRAENEKLKTIIKHAVAERTGVYFICGGSEPLDQHGLPHTLLICPAYGLDGFAIYTKTSDYSAPSY